MNVRRLVISAHDVLATAAALLIAFLLRWGTAEFLTRFDRIALVCAATLPLALAAYWFFGLPRSPWRFVSIPDLGRIAAAAAVPAVFLAVVDFLARGEVVVPRTVPVIYWLVQVALLAGPRILYRSYRTRRRDRRAFRGAYRMPVIVAGAGDEADQLIRRLRQDAVSSLDPVGILSPQRRHLGERLHGIPIMGSLADLETAMRQLEIRQIRPRRLLITREVLAREEDVDGLLVTARRLGLTTVRLSQSLREVDQDGQVPLQLAPVSIDDLLGRSAREMDLSPVRALLAGRRVLVTGAGGSIGQELSRQIAAMDPSGLMLLDQSELALWSIGRELRDRAGPDVTLRLGDVRDARGLAEIFAVFRPELVFHAAALKHVDLVEGHPVAAAATNTLGTLEVARAALAAGASCSVFISTDKAVDPVSVLGATKRAGETIFAATDRRCRQDGVDARFLTVRFGNVLGSSGSVIPLFTEQLRSGGPLTVTHPEVERYFMTISEAVRLVLMASAEGMRERDGSPVFVLDMGQPIRIVDLARRMIRLAGLEPDVDVEIAFTGLRPGERLSEALESEGEQLVPTGVAGVRATEARAVDADKLDDEIARLRAAVERHDERGVRSALATMVPEYHPADAAEAPTDLPPKLRLVTG